VEKKKEETKKDKVNPENKDSYKKLER